MKRNRWAAAVVAGALVVLAAVVFRPARRPGGEHAGHAQPAVKQVYYCPMHPTYTSDRPGECPICHMDLVRREPEPQAQPASQAKDICVMHNCPMLHEGRPCPMLVVSAPGEEVSCPVCGSHVTGQENEGSKAAGYAAVVLSPQKRQMIGVKTAPVEKKKITRTLRAAGRIAYDPELYQAEQEYLQALRLEPAGTAGLTDAARTRLKLLGLSDSFIRQMADWEGPDRRLLLPSEKGEVWVYASVYENDLPLLREGQPLKVESPSGKELEGSIVSIDPVLDPATRTARVRSLVTDPDRVLRPEMFVHVSVSISGAETLSVPSEAVMDTGVRKILFVDQGGGLLEPREVQTGVKGEGFWEILSGVAEGESVVVNGNFLVDSESRLKAALEGMGGGGHQHGQ